MTGLLRNSDLVVMSSYAPLLARADAYQWAPDLIWFDNTRVFGTPSYYVQRMYSRNRPDVLLPVEVKGDPVDLERLPPKAVATFGAEPLDPYSPETIPTLYATAGLSKARNEAVLFLVNPFPEERSADIRLRGRKLGAQAKVIRLTGNDPEMINSLDAPTNVAPTESSIALQGTQMVTALPAYSLTVMRVPLAR